MLVDDDQDFLELLQERLQMNKFEVIIAGNGMECIEKAQEQKPNLILTDLIMPDMDGAELVRVLKSNSLTQNIPIVFLTGAVIKEDVAQDNKKINVDGSWYGVVAKPFDASMLMNEIDRYFVNPSDPIKRDLK